VVSRRKVSTNMVTNMAASMAATATPDERRSCGDA